MKEVTYEEWQKNPTPRKMRVWKDDEKSYVIRKVVYILKENYVLNRVIAIDNDESDFDLYRHCAEIEEPKTRRMTNKELSRWLREKPTREYRDIGDSWIYCDNPYEENCGDKEVDESVVIREDDGKWREPLVEVEE